MRAYVTGSQSMKRKFSVTVEEEIADRADELAGHLGVTRSGFVEEAMARHLRDALDSGGAVRWLADRHAQAVSGIGAIQAGGRS